MWQYLPKLLSKKSQQSALLTCIRWNQMRCNFWKMTLSYKQLIRIFSMTINLLLALRYSSLSLLWYIFGSVPSRWCLEAVSITTSSVLLLAAYILPILLFSTFHNTKIKNLKLSQTGILSTRCTLRKRL